MCWFALPSYSLSCFTCFFSWFINLFRGSSFITGWFVIYEALVAYVSVDTFSYKNWSHGFIQAIIRLYEFPPIDCFKIEVSFESL